MEAAARNLVPAERALPVFSFVAVVLAAAAAAGAVPLARLPAADLSAAFWLMAALALVVDARPFTAPVPGRVAAIYPSVCFSFAILLMWGPGPAIAVQTAAVAVSSWRMRRAPWRMVFNIGQYALAFVAAGGVLRLFGTDAFGDGPPASSQVVAVVLAAATWFLFKYGTVTVTLRLYFGGSLGRIFTRALTSDALTYGALLLLSPVLVAAARLSAALVPLVLVPLYAVHRMAQLAEEQRRQAEHCGLTGLANRKALIDTITDRVSARGPGGGPFALLLLDLDGFKHVNDALGHEVGDRLLVEVGRRLSGVVGPADLLARLGGDEFAIVAPGAADVAAARALAARVAAALADPISLDGLPLDVGGSIGIALYPDHGADFATLMRHADVAMYDAKHRAAAVAVYTPESDHNSPQRLALLADLRRALQAADSDSDSDGGGDGDSGGDGDGDGDGDGITMYYQPQVAIATGQVVGVEALLRWRHPTRGPVNPEELIRVAEHTAVMRPLTLRVVDKVVAQMAAWDVAGLRLRTSINVSVRDLHTMDVADRIAERLREHGVPPDQLQLEITEGALMADPRRVLATIANLHRLGVALSLDDFGTGYSSMQHLRRLPLAEVKVDRSFVLGMATDTDDAAIVRSVIELAGALGLRVVAEGVEDEPTWRLLADAGCHVAQGWFYARPMPGDELVSWLARYRPLTAWAGAADDPGQSPANETLPVDSPSDNHQGRGGTPGAPRATGRHRR